MEIELYDVVTQMTWVYDAGLPEAIVLAGGLILLAYFGVRVGFKFAKKLLNRTHRSV